MDMTRSNFIRLSGWAIVAAAICLLLTFSSWPLAFFFANLFLTVGLLGLLDRYGQQTGPAGQIALLLACIGGATSIALSLRLASGNEQVRLSMNYAMVVMYLGLFTFGLVTLRQKPLPPRTNGLPVLAGFWWPFIVIGANVYYQAAGQWLPVPAWLSFTLFGMLALSLAALGFVLQAGTPQRQALA